MATQTKARVSLESFLAIPGIDERRAELLDGEVVEKPMPTWEHGEVAFLIGLALHPHGRVAVEARAVIPETPSRSASAPIPDVAFYAASPPPRGQWMTRPPDVAIEVVSPGQSRQEIRAKVDLYLDFGVRSVWVVDPEWGMVEVYEGAERRTYTGEDAVFSAVVPELALTPAALFAGLE